MQRVPKNGKSFVVLFFKKGPLAFTLRELPSIRISISADARIGDEKAVALMAGRKMEVWRPCLQRRPGAEPLAFILTPSKP